MKILIYSSRFYPQVGGMETVVMQLATSFAETGNDVVLLTPTSINSNDETDTTYPFQVIRNPSKTRRFELARWASVIVHNSVSLKALFPDFLFLRKVFVIHHTWYSGNNLRERLSGFLKLGFCKLVNNIYISQAVQDHVGEKGVTIPNPYDSKLFRRIPEIAKTKDIVF